MTKDRTISSIRADLQLIADMIDPGSRVLDVGCEDGALLDYLVHNKQVVGRGMELSQKGVNASVSHGLSVIQGDADENLIDYPDQAFDYVVLSKTLQATRRPKEVLNQLPVCWYETENIHFCTIRDFIGLTRECGITVDKAMSISANRQAREITNLSRANLFGRDGIFLLRKK